MVDQKQNPAALACARPGSRNNSSTNCTPLPAPKKWRRVLRALLDGGSFNRFEAERQSSDHCLHSTVSRLEGMRVRIRRGDETVAGFQGLPTHVCRYWLDPESREKASQLLGGTQPERTGQTAPEALL
jgi:hypothetical protein